MPGRRTKFDSSNFYFSQAASLAAVHDIYEPLAQTLAGDRRARGYFDPVDNDGRERQWGEKVPESQQEDVFDGVDGRLTVQPPIGQKKVYTVQERFRRPKYARYRQVTATESNAATGSDGDFDKLKADLYVYGYYDHGGFAEAVVLDVPRWKRLVEKGFLTPDD